MDTIFVRDLKVRTIVGVWDWERRMPQDVLIDLDMGTDIRKAAASARIEDTLDYKALTRRIRSFVAESRFHLIETLAEQVAGIVTGEFGVPWVRVAVRKPGAIRGSRDVGIAIERGQRR